MIARVSIGAVIFAVAGVVSASPRATHDASARATVAAAPHSDDHAARAASPVDVDWQTSPLDLDLRGMNGERYAFHCPPGKPTPARVVGSGPYADNASICGAAVHAGVLRAKDGGDVAIEIRPGETSYVGSESHYIRSTPYERAWGGSFVVLRNGTAPSP